VIKNEEISENICPYEMKSTQTTMLLYAHTIKVTLGVVKKLNFFVGPHMLPIDFVVIDMPLDPLYPIIFSKPFLKTSRAKIDHIREVVSLRFGKAELLQIQNQPYPKTANTKEQHIACKQVHL
jgi:hypothetical protein